jgi:hypothetical protein
MARVVGRRADAARSLLAACVDMGYGAERILPGRRRVLAWMRRCGNLATGSPDPWKLTVKHLRDTLGIMQTHASRYTSLSRGWTLGLLLTNMEAASSPSTRSHPKPPKPLLPPILACPRKPQLLVCRTKLRKQPRPQRAALW